MSTVLVTDAGRGSAVAFIRSLARAGHHVVAGDDALVSSGRWSRSSAESFRYPDPYDDPDGAAERLLEAVVEHDVDVVLPMTDATTRAVTSIADRLPAGCVVGTPPADAASVAADKDRTVRLARDLGVPVPTTVVAASGAEAPAAAAEAALGWPVVVKPVTSVVADDHGTLRKFTVGYGHDPDDLRRQVDELGRGGPVLLQEYVAGDGIGVEVLADRGRVVRSFSHRRLHEVPVTGGASALRTSIAVDPDLLDHTRRMMEALEWSGLAMVEFKAGANGFRLMEINGRPWGSLPLAVRAGVDFPADYVTLLTRGADRLGPEPVHEIGTIARNLQLETVWIGSVLRGRPDGDGATTGPFPPRRAALAAALRLFSANVADDVLSWRDPGASAAELLSIVAKLTGKMRGGRRDG